MADAVHLAADVVLEDAEVTVRLMTKESVASPKNRVLAADVAAAVATSIFNETTKSFRGMMCG